ncbi:MAG: M20 family peptidase, partial [Mesorhizobium sp.]
MSDKFSNGLPFDTQAMLDEIKSWVEIETPTEDAVAVNRLVDKIETEATAAGAT